MSEYSDRRNARARALGYTSYSQMYRANKRGYPTAVQYQAAVQVNQTNKLQKSKLAANLIGIRSTRAATVVAASSGVTGQLRAQWHAISGRKSDRHVTLVVETSDGQVRRPGGKYGFSVEYLEELMDEFDTWDDVLDYLDSEIYGDGAYSGGPATVTATIR